MQALIEQLGSRKFSDREQANKELDALGAAALPGLKKASEGDDLETSRRAKEIIRRIEDRTKTASILEPKKSAST